MAGESPDARKGQSTFRFIFIGDNFVTIVQQGSACLVFVYKLCPELLPERAGDVVMPVERTSLVNVAMPPPKVSADIEAIKHIKPEEVQKSLWELDFQELKNILKQVDLQPLSEDRVEWVIARAEDGHKQDARQGKAVMPHYYVIQQLQGLHDNLFSGFMTTFRSRMQEKLLKAFSNNAENQ